MNPSEVLRRLWKEQKTWQAMSDREPEVQWTVRGIKLSVAHVRDIIRDQRTNDRLKSPKVDHQHATKLFRACRGALHELKLCNHRIAVKILQNALARIPETHK